MPPRPARDHRPGLALRAHPRLRQLPARWTPPHGSAGDTTARRDPAAALAKATALDRRLARAAGPAAMTPRGQVAAACLAHGCSPYTDEPWRSSTRNQIQDNLTRCLRGHELVAALDLDRALCDRMRAQAGTPNMVRVNTTALRAFLLWGYRTNPSYFTPEESSTSPPAW